MATIYHWFSRQFGKFVLLPDYFRVLAMEWLNILFGETLVGIAFLLWWSLAGPSNAKLIVVFVAAMFIAGYYAWRADHVRLMPELEVKDFTRLTIDTFDQTGKKNGWSEYIQLLPRCLTEANVEECRGLHTSIEMLIGFTNAWEPAEEEAMFLEWSHSDAEPITLYPHAERRLNVFFMHSSNRESRPCVTPYPVRFFTMFNQLELRQIKAIRFKTQIIAKDCRVEPLNSRSKFNSAMTILTQPWSWSFNWVTISPHSHRIVHTFDSGAAITEPVRHEPASLANTTVVQELLSLGRSRVAAMWICSLGRSPRMIGQ